MFVATIVESRACEGDVCLSLRFSPAEDPLTAGGGIAGEGAPDLRSLASGEGVRPVGRVGANSATVAMFEIPSPKRLGAWLESVEATDSVVRGRLSIGGDLNPYSDAGVLLGTRGSDVDGLESYSKAVLLLGAAMKLEKPPSGLYVPGKAGEGLGDSPARGGNTDARASPSPGILGVGALDSSAFEENNSAGARSRRPGLAL
jgi:hypothetical protein